MAMPRLPGQFGSSCEHLAPVFGLVAGAGMHRRAPGVHEHAAIRLLLVAHLDHVNIALQAKQLASQRQGRTPLARAGLGGEAFGAGDLVVIGLGDGGVGLVAAGGTGAFVFVVNVRRRLERLLEAHRAQQRRGPPQRVNFADLVGDRDPAVGAHFLLDEVFRENRQQGLRRYRLFGARMQRRRQRLGKVRQKIIPLFGNVLLAQRETDFRAHKCQKMLANKLPSPNPLVTQLLAIARNVNNQNQMDLFKNSGPVVGWFRVPPSGGPRGTSCQLPP